jgi:hypothetical protein
MASLQADPRLLKEFIKWAKGGKPRGRIVTLEQALPEEPPGTRERDESQRRGLPDGWIHDANGWALLIESKVAASPSDDQIERHLRTARRRGFERPRLLWLTVTPVGRRLAPGVANRTWADLYEWLVRRQRWSNWARRVAEYLEIAEVQADMKKHLKEGTLTRFAGIRFDDNNPYSYSQAKRLMGLLRDELRRRKDLARVLGMNRHCPGRGAITGRSSTAVWDFISIRASKKDNVFTQHMHLTLGITDERVDAYITVPNGIRSRLRSALLGEDFSDFHAIIAETTRLLDKALRRYPGGQPAITVVQRRFSTQRSEARVDAVLRFDPRTAIPVKPRAAERSVLLQPQWLIAIDEALRHRRANLQLQIGAAFPYKKSPVTRTTRIIDAVADVWLACEPVVGVLRRNKKGRVSKARRGKRRRRAV